MFKCTKKYQQVRPFILEKLRNLFYKNKNNLTEEQRQYLLSGINPEILKAYNIIYSSNTLYFKADKKGTDISKGLEYKVSSSDSRKASFAERMKAIELNHLKKLNEIYSSVVENYNKGMDKPRDILIYNGSDGSVRVSFS